MKRFLIVLSLLISVGSPVVAGGSAPMPGYQPGPCDPPFC